MTLQEAVKVSNHVFKIEAYQALVEEILGLNGLQELKDCFREEELEAELTGVVQIRLDKLLKELEEM